MTVRHGAPSSPGPHRALRRTSGGVRSRLSLRIWTPNQISINMVRQMDEAVASLHVPDVLRTGTGE
jgi:hypothetical protein